MGGIAKIYTKNKLGITIVKCCSSCAKHINEGDVHTRKCRMTGCRHAPDYLCNEWVMNESLEKAGMGGGRVKKKAYFDYLMENGSHHADDFEREFGSKYLTKK